MKNALMAVGEVSPKISSDIQRISWTSYGGIGTAETSLTGSSHIVEIVRKSGETVRILLDCGMFQGKGSNRNETLPYNPASIDHTILSHAHIDHSGRLPLMTNGKNPFLGEIYCTPITREATLLSLKDSAKISEENYDERQAQYIKNGHKLREAERIVENAENKGVPRNARNHDRLTGTGELPPEVGEGEGGIRIKNRFHGGSAIHEVSEEKVIQMRELLAEWGLYDLKKGLFTKKTIQQVNKPPKKNLYTVKEVENLELYFRTVGYNKPIILEPGVEMTFLNAGHIPGSSMVLLKFKVEDEQDYTLLFSGDLGRVRGDFHPYGTPVIPPEIPIDTFVHETTYGGEVHIERELAIEELGKVIRKAFLERKKAVIIPTFAMERCAAILHHLIELKKDLYFDGEIILDTPLGYSQTLVAIKASDDPTFIENLSDKKNIRFFEKADRPGISKGRKFRVIVTGSGMANGGPIMDYLKLYSNDPNFEFAFAGYQAEGTDGRRLTEKGSERKRSLVIDGLKLEVSAKVHLLSGHSAHADERELFQIFDYGKRSKRHKARQEKAKLLLVHGDDTSSIPAYQHYLDRRKKEGKRGIPKSENIYIPKLESEVVLYDTTPKESSEIQE